MRTKPYVDFPRLSEWKKDSAVPNAFRWKDRVLCRIDNLVKAYEMTNDEAEEMYVKCELYFAMNYWLRNVKRPHMARMNADREPAIRALNDLVSIYLSNDFKCLINKLDDELARYFGRDMTQHGINIDKNYPANYFHNAAKRDKFRLRFRRPWWSAWAKAYMVPWQKAVGGGTAKPVLASSKELMAQSRSRLQDLLVGGWAFFVMSMERDIYMIPHQVSFPYQSEAPVYHSSILAGGTVASAGTILIENGYILGLRTDSGHYRPTHSHMVSVLEHLKTVDVDIRNIDMYACFGGLAKIGGAPVDYGDAYCKGDEFLRARGNWKIILERQRRSHPWRRKWEGDVQKQHMGGTNSFEDIVIQRYNALKKTNKHLRGANGWRLAHRQAALALSEVNPAYFATADQKPSKPPKPPR